jgi:hypothetical protein
MEGSARDAMAALRAEIAARLEKNEDYRALKALDTALAELGHASSVAVSGRMFIRARSFREVARAGAREQQISQADAAEKVMDRAGEPVPIAELVQKVREEGAQVGGSDPHINLSSTLSKDDRFRSVRYGGRQAWWLRRRRYPGEQMELAAQSPSGDEGSL